MYDSTCRMLNLQSNLEELAASRRLMDHKLSAVNGYRSIGVSQTWRTTGDGSLLACVAKQEQQHFKLSPAERHARSFRLGEVLLRSRMQEIVCHCRSPG